MKEQAYLNELMDRYPILQPVRESIAEAYKVLRECFESGHKLLVAGNGGSAADSEHMVGELMKGFVKQRLMSEDMAKKLEAVDLEAGKELSSKLQGGLPTIALTGHPGLSTAFLNDVDGLMVYAQQVYGYGKEGDVLLGISTSGNATNIYYALVTAKAKGMKVIGLTGKDGGKLGKQADVAVIVPEQETFKIQELHLPIYHTLCLIRGVFFLMNLRFHTFVICAYGKSPYLRACIRSLKAQTVPTRIICTTSTPSPWLEKVLKEQEIPLYIRKGESNIQEDWNYAIQKAESRFVTIAHQDDLYSRHYVEELSKAASRYPDMTVFMSDGVLIKKEKIAWGGAVELVKKILRFPWRIKGLCHLSIVKKSGLILGNPVMCPSCSYQKALVDLPLFSGGYGYVLDWECMRKLADQPGRFVCVEKPLLYYRIHNGAATKECIKNHRREQEEQQMFEKMWPRQIAAALMKVYQMAYWNYQ